MKTYIIRRILLMIPTIFGITLIQFLIMQLAPGDPAKLQLSQSGAAEESTFAHEQYLLRKRQWKLDKPLFLNFRYFKNYSEQARFCSTFNGMSEEELLNSLTSLAEKLDHPDPESEQNLRFLKSFEIENFHGRLKDPNQRKQLPKVITGTAGIRGRIHDISEYALNYFVDILKQSTDLRLKIGAIRCLAIATFGDPFTYTYSADPLPEETPAVAGTWKIWWEREQNNYQPLGPDRRKGIEDRIAAWVAEPSREKLLESIVAAYQSKVIAKSDAPYFVEKLTGTTTLKEKYVSAIVLKSMFGKPLKSDVKVTDPEPKVSEVASNWISYFTVLGERYQPSFLSRVGYIFSDSQYAHMLVNLLTFSFGKSMVPPFDPVGRKIWDAVMVSLPLILLSQLIVYLIAVPSGILCSITRGRWLDRMISLGLFLLNSVPSFVAGMLFLSVLCYGNPFYIFPMNGLHTDGYQSFGPLQYILDYALHIFLPVICMSVFSMAALAMYARSSMLDVVNQDYIRTARAKGLSEAVVILKHALRNGLIPIITLFANFLPALLGGSVLIETIFGIPGMGRMSFQSLEAKDYNTLMALIYVDAIVVLGSYILSDLLYVVVDPRISFEKAGKTA